MAINPTHNNKTKFNQYWPAITSRLMMPCKHNIDVSIVKNNIRINFWVFVCHANDFKLYTQYIVVLFGVEICVHDNTVAHKVSHNVDSGSANDC